MNKKHLILLYTVLLSLIFSNALANKASVQIEVPEKAAMGEVILIRLLVSHEGNNFIHYIDWVYVAINGKEVKKWTFSNFDRPESENFTLTIEHTMTGPGPVEITAEADCNIHGSAGIARKNVAIK